MPQHDWIISSIEVNMLNNKMTITPIVSYQNHFSNPQKHWNIRCSHPYFLGWPPLSPHTFEHVCIIKSNGMPVKFTICWYDTTHTTIDCMPVITGKAQIAYFCNRLLKMCPRLRVRKRSNKYFTLQRLSCLRFYPKNRVYHFVLLFLLRKTPGLCPRTAWYLHRKRRRK